MEQSRKNLAITAMDYRYSVLTPDQLSGLTPDQLSGLTPDQLSVLTPYQLSGLTPYQLRGLTPYQLSGLTPYQLSVLTPDQLRVLTPYQLSVLTPYQLRVLTPDQLRVLTPYQLSGLTPYQLSGLTPDQLRVLKKYTEIMEEMPTLKMPYSKMLEKIRAREIVHRQSTFGDDDPAKNTCGTPMCTAGHLVYMAGDAGIKAAKAFGYANAALMIHFKAHPDHPPQNFGAIPQDAALAYIEYMAEIEAQGGSNAG